KKAGQWKEFLPPEAAKTLLTREAKNLQELLAGKAEDETIAKVQFAALMIDGYGRSSKAHPIMGMAQNVSRNIARNAGIKAKWAELKTLAGTLPLEAKAQEVPILAGTDVQKELGQFMDVYRLKAKGGEGLPDVLQVTPRLKTALNGQEELIRYLAGKAM